MAHLILPPSSVQPMTKEDIAVVQAEKRVDAATRAQLVKVYGDSRDPHGRAIHLTRPPHRNWKCSSCGKVSTDIRHVCGYCLQPEPGYHNPSLVNSNSKSSGDTQFATAVNGRRAGTSNDAGVQLLKIPSTGFTYRLFSEAHVPTAAKHSREAQCVKRAVEAAEVRHEMGVKDRDEDEDAVWDDEPDCGEGRFVGDGGEEQEEAKAKAERRAPNEEKSDKKFTHFVSIPIGKLPAITANANRVLEDLRSFVSTAASLDHVEKDGAGAGDDDNQSRAAATGSTVSHSRSAATPELVTSTPKLHMTLLLLTLPNREDVEFAKELLQGPFAAAWTAVKSSNNDSNNNSETLGLLLSGDSSLAPLHRHPLIRLGGGLQVMKAGKDNELYHPERASVVYMGIDDPAAHATVQRLQRVLHDSFAELIQDFDEAERSRRVLHVTIMNKSWRKGRGARRPFDARPILEAFQEAAIGAGDDGRHLFEIPELELCSMRRHEAETGTYLTEAVVKI